MKKAFRTIALQLGRVLFSLAIDRVLRRELPAIFAKLDKELPYMLVDGANPGQVEATVIDAIEERIGKEATGTQISAILSLYDPIKAAIRNIKR
tara:strand:- start:722 stop:1003 length:282 start_codon:yes stop_codon:yes gene_type:complete